MLDNWIKELEAQINPPFNSSEDKNIINISFFPMLSHAWNKSLLFSLFKLGPELDSYAIYRLAKQLYVGPAASWEWSSSNFWWPVT